jgi:cytochrome c-type biogenesis protein CcmH
MKRAARGASHGARAWAAAVLLLISTSTGAQALDVAKPDAVVEARVKALGEELRCLVCQNQTIADSSAPLALDLRNQIRVQVAQGRSDDQIRGYMVDRYGDFVLYRPPFKATTAILWVGPFVLVAVGFGIAFAVVRRRRRDDERPRLTAERREAIERMLGS